MSAEPLPTQPPPFFSFTYTYVSQRTTAGKSLTLVFLNTYYNKRYASQQLITTTSGPPAHTGPC
jgi:hypothetical protein